MIELKGKLGCHPRLLPVRYSEARRPRQKTFDGLAAVHTIEVTNIPRAL